jgi:predicted ATPase
MERVGVPASERTRLIAFARGEQSSEEIPTQAPTDNLPHPLSSFIGRENEIVEILRLLQESRLVTLTGAGGSGKTRLSIEIGRRLVECFPEGVWFVSFASLLAPASIPQTIAGVLRVRERADCPLIQTLIEYLRHKHVLLIFDNCEHLIAQCAQTAETLLQACPELSILATSREVLNIAGEEQYSVPSLSLPDANRTTALEHLLCSEAVRLFVERAKAVRSDFKLTSENAAAVVQICQHLDGIPLSLELAAALVKGSNVQEIASRLNDRFHLLTGGSRTALPRQRTLQATIDWSYNLLSEQERTLLRRLAIFPGSWTLEAAEYICADDDLSSKAVQDLHLHLIDKSLVIMETDGLESRYHMLETIRQYALEKLLQSGEVEHTRARHLHFFLRLSQRTELGFRGPDFRLWLDRMDRERDNLRMDLNYAINSGQSETALQLIGSAFWVWWMLGPWSEGQRWVETVLSTASFKPTASKAKALLALGLFHFSQSDYLKSQKILEQSIVIWDSLEDKLWYVLANTMLGYVLHRQKQPSASDVLRNAVQMAREMNDKWLLALCLLPLGQYEFYNGNLTEGRSMTEESLALIHTLGDHMMRGDVLGQLGEIADVEQDYPNALRWYTEGLAVARDAGDMDTVTNLEFDMGRIFQICGEDDQAVHLFKDVLQTSIQVGKKSMVTAALAGLGVVSQARGDLERSIRLIAASESLYDNLSKSVNANPMDRVWLDEHVAAARAQLGEEKYSALSEEGKKMTVEQAVIYALGNDSSV